MVVWLERRTDFDWKIGGWVPLHCRCASLVRKIYSTLFFSSKVYKWVTATYTAEGKHEITGISLLPLAHPLDGLLVQNRILQDTQHEVTRSRTLMGYGATCTVGNVLHGWSREQQSEQQNNAPNLKINNVATG